MFNSLNPLIGFSVLDWYTNTGKIKIPLRLNPLIGFSVLDFKNYGRQKRKFKKIGLNPLIGFSVLDSITFLAL